MLVCVRGFQRGGLGEMLWYLNEHRVKANSFLKLHLFASPSNTNLVIPFAEVTVATKKYQGQNRRFTRNRKRSKSVVAGDPKITASATAKYTIEDLPEGRFFAQLCVCFSTLGVLVDYLILLVTITLCPEPFSCPIVWERFITPPPGQWNRHRRFQVHTLAKDMMPPEIFKRISAKTS